MIGLVIVSHGELGDALLNTAALIYGSCQRCTALKLLPGGRVEELTERIVAAAKTLDESDGIIIMVDMTGGSCANAALMATRDWQGSQLVVVTGANLSMVLQVLHRRESMPVLELMRKILDTGRQGISRLYPPLSGEGMLGAM
jgi:PTS system mannose-specific IIA component